MARITVTEVNKVKFYQVPKAFFHNPKYTSMNSDAKLAYAILRDLLDLSIENNWVNDKREVFVKLSREKLMVRLNIKGTQKMTKVMNELKQFGLIEEEQVGLNKCNEIYICTPENLSELYDDKDLLECKKNSKNKNKSGLLKIKSPIKHSNINGHLKIKSQEILKSKVKSFENQKHTNTNYIKTNTISSSCSTPSMKELYLLFEEAFNKKPSSYMKKKINRFIEESNLEFVISILEYSIERNAKSPAYLFKTLEELITKNITTVEAFRESIESYYDNKEQETKNHSESKLKANKSTIKVSSKLNNSNKKKPIANFTERDNYDFDNLEAGLLGWDENIDVDDIFKKD